MPIWCVYVTRPSWRNESKHFMNILSYVFHIILHSFVFKMSHCLTKWTKR